MSMIFKVLIAVFMAGIFGLVSMSYLYITKADGAITLAKAPGVVVITREMDTEIAHIRGDSFKAVSYGQGYAHA
jgi:acyl-homoserine lactone acylase PvdQ